MDLNPLPIVNEHAFDSVPSLEMMWVLLSYGTDYAVDSFTLVSFSYLPTEVKIQRQAFAEMKLDKETFDGFVRIPIHPLEDPNDVAFSKYEPVEIE